MTEQAERPATVGLDHRLARVERQLLDAAMDYARSVERAAREPLGNLVVITREEFWVLVQAQTILRRVNGLLPTTDPVARRLCAIRPTTLDGETPQPEPQSGVCVQGPQIIFDGEPMEMEAEVAERLRRLIQDAATTRQRVVTMGGHAAPTSEEVDARDRVARRAAEERWRAGRERWVERMVQGECDGCGAVAPLCNDDRDVFRFCRDCHPENVHACSGCEFCRCADCEGNR